jgi:hypothetical protein
MEVWEKALTLMICGDDGVEPRKASSRVLFDAEVSAEGETCRFFDDGVHGVLGELRTIPSRSRAAILNGGVNGVKDY